MLYTNLKHLETAVDYVKFISENENVMLVCGRMDPMCIAVYGIAEQFEGEYKHVKFCDMEFDNPESYIVRELEVIQDLRSIPFAIYYKNGKVAFTTSGIQTKTEVKAILDKEFAVTVNV